MDWEKNRSMKDNISYILGIKQIHKLSDRSFSILWTDDQYCEIDVVKLRSLCVCSQCLTKNSQGKNSDKNTFDYSNVRPVIIKSMGRYALEVSFNDGDKSSIYPYTMLKKHFCNNQID